MGEAKQYRIVNIWGYYEEGKYLESRAPGMVVPIKCLFHEWGTAITADDKLVTVGICEQVNTGKVYLASPDCMNFLNHEIKVSK